MASQQIAGSAQFEHGRFCDEITVAVTTSATTTDVIDMAGLAGAIVCLPNGSTITTLTWYVVAADGTTNFALLDAAGDPVANTAIAANEAQPVPLECFAAARIKAVGDAAGTIRIMRKS